MCRLSGTTNLKTTPICNLARSKLLKPKALPNRNYKRFSKSENFGVEVVTAVAVAVVVPMTLHRPIRKVQSLRHSNTPKHTQPTIVLTFPNFKHRCNWLLHPQLVVVARAQNIHLPEHCTSATIEKKNVYKLLYRVALPSSYFFLRFFFGYCSCCCC